MKLVIAPTILNRLLKINAEYIHIQKSKIDGYIDFILRIDEDFRGS